MSTTRRISRLLIANRGEIAVRIARTAHRLGITTIGVYSENDRDALHVDAVDIAVALGGTTPAASYLRGDAIIQAALDTGADAIHPGYGFLAENADFAEAVLASGLVWVGPTPTQVRLLGDKIAAKRAAIDAGVPTTDIIEVSPDSIPDDLTLPALVKAAAGGGGRGMRVVHDRNALGEAVTSASREAASAFGDGTVFVEPFIEHGRHVEVQVFGDSHGNVIHLGDRECSIQRRNQKVVEEAPSPGINDATRARLLAGAVALARHVGYAGAGTVEFMVGEPGADGEPVVTFLEVNARLQVEHPVTEAVTGVDLVELQLHVAEGRPLPFEQDDITISGHAIEVRLVAEDPAAGWLPSIGTLTEFAIDDLDGAVRIDAGFRAGDRVSSDYDSLLAKVVAHTARRDATARMIGRAMRSARVSGIRTNASTLAAIMCETDFLDGATYTSYLDDHPEVGTAATLAPTDREAHFLAAVFAIEHANRRADRATGFAPSGWRNLRTQGRRLSLVYDGVDEPASDGSFTSGTHRGITFSAEYVLGERMPADTDPAEVEVKLGAWPMPDDHGVLRDDHRRQPRVRLIGRSDHRQVIEIDGIRHVIDVQRVGDSITTASSCGAATWLVPQRFDTHDTAAAGSGPVSPLPGTVVSIHVNPGDSVTDGQLLVVVEAMKMEHKITAADSGVVGAVHVGAGDRVDAGVLLVTIEHVADVGADHD